MNDAPFIVIERYHPALYNNRIKNPARTIQFIDEANGGDIYTKIECAIKSYIINLLNSNVKVDMHFHFAG